MTAKILTALALKYIAFMTGIGSDVPETDFQHCLPEIFAENIKKIENGKLIVTGYQELESQLKNAQKFGAPWTLEILDVLVDESKNMAAIRFTWNSLKVGLHITTAILKFDKNHKITEIKEVYSVHGDVTH